MTNRDDNGRKEKEEKNCAFFYKKKVRDDIRRKRILVIPTKCDKENWWGIAFSFLYIKNCQKNIPQEIEKKNYSPSSFFCKKKDPTTEVSNSKVQ